MTINFKPQFADAIKGGQKCQTVRKKGKRKFKVGQQLQLYMGQRTSKCRKIADSVVTKLQEIYIDKYDGFTLPNVEVDGKQIWADELTALAIADGFEHWSHFIEFFHYHYPLPFVGQIIHWEAPGEFN